MTVTGQWRALRSREFPRVLQKAAQAVYIPDESPVLA